MIKIVEIKGGLKALEDQKELTFEDKGFIIGKSRRKGFSGSQGLYYQLRTQERVNVISRAQIEETMGGISSNRENGITIHTSAEGYRVFQEAPQTEASRQLEEIERREQLRIVREIQSLPLILGTGGESANRYAYGVDPYMPSFTEPPIRSIDPETGNTVVTQNSNSATFSRDMTEEQMIAYFDSLD